MKRTNFILLAVTFFAWLGCFSSKTFAQTWETIGGIANDISVGADGSVWIVSNSNGVVDHPIFKYDGGWKPMPGAAVCIAVDPQGKAWVANSAGNIFKWNGTAWDAVFGLAKDIGIGADGTVWVVGTTNDLFKRVNNAWVQVPGSGTNISVGPDGNPWTRSSDGTIRKGTVVSAQATVNMKFTNTGTKSVEIWSTNSTGLPVEKLSTIGNNGIVTLPVKLYDQFLVKTPYIATANTGSNDLFSYHPKIAITDLASTGIIILGNLPANEARSTGGLTYQIPDYEPNCSGIDLTVLNPRDLVTSINKAQVFEKLNPQSGVDYSTTGNKLVKYGFTFAGMNTSSGSDDMKMAYGYTSFSKDFSINVGGSVPVKGVTVSGSVGYHMSEDSENSEESVYTYSRAQTSVFKVTVDPAKARLTPEFINDVLSIQSQQDALDLIVAKYGTNYPKTIIYGGDRSVYQVMTKNQYSSAKSWGVDVKLAVSQSKTALESTTAKYDASGNSTANEYKYGDKKGASGSLDFSYSQSEQTKSLLQNTSSKYRLIGGSGGLSSGWTVNEGNSAPISVEVGSLADLIDIKVFKEGTTAEVLAQKKAWVEQAIAQYLQNLQFLNQPMPEPVVYTFIADKYKRTSAFWEDTNVGIKGTVALSVWKEGETITAAEHSHLLWEKPDFTGDWNTYAFVQDKEFPFNREHAVNNARFTYVQYPEPNGTFKKLNFQIGGDFYEADDLDSPDHICGNNVIQDAKTFLGTTAVNTDKTGTFDIIDNCDNERQKINITYKVKREPSEFAGLVGN